MRGTAARTREERSAASLFFNSKPERIALARQRYFEEGLLPSGIVSDAVYESWARCQRLHPGPSAKVAFEPVTTSRAHLALQKNRDLVQAWLEELPRLETVLGTTSCAAMLTDGSGVLIGASCVGRSHERLMPIATRIGVNLCEEAVGTTAPGVAARTGRAVSVDGAEHFFDDVRGMHCAAAPIRDVHGRLAGILDLSSESIPFNFDASAVVGLYAAAIENRLFISQSVDHLVVRFQIDVNLLDSNFVALAGIDASGRLAWTNVTAARLLGLSSASQDAKTETAEEALGADFSRLASLPNQGAAILRLKNGLMVWARSEMRAADGRRDFVSAHEVGRNREPVPGGGLAAGLAKGDEPMKDPVAPAPDARAASVRADEDDRHSTRLRDSDKSLIEKTLNVHGGNVSKAAQALGVSRGLIYRRLREREREN